MCGAEEYVFESCGLIRSLSATIAVSKHSWATRGMDGGRERERGVEGGRDTRGMDGATAQCSHTKRGAAEWARVHAPLRAGRAEGRGRSFHLKITLSHTPLTLKAGRSWGDQERWETLSVFFSFYIFYTSSSLRGEPIFVKTSAIRDFSGKTWQERTRKGRKSEKAVANGGGWGGRRKFWASHWSSERLVKVRGFISTPELGLGLSSV